MDNGEKELRYIKQNDEGLYLLTLYSGECAFLWYLLSPSIPYVWIRHHWPNNSGGWWQTQLALSQKSPPRTVMARSIEFDLLFSYQEFMEWLDDFADSGIEVYQSVKPIPNSLDLDRVTSKSRSRIFFQNGIKTGFLLPHYGETAVFWSSELNIVEQALAHPVVRDEAIAVGDDCNSKL